MPGDFWKVIEILVIIVVPIVITAVGFFVKGLKSQIKESKDEMDKKLLAQDAKHEKAIDELKEDHKSKNDTRDNEIRSLHIRIDKCEKKQEDDFRSLSADLATVMGDIKVIISLLKSKDK